MISYVFTKTNNVDLFAWMANGMLGVNLNVISHKLSIYKEVRLVFQKKRKFEDEKGKTTKGKLRS